MSDLEARKSDKSNVEKEDWEPLTQKEYEEYKKAGKTVEENLIKENETRRKKEVPNITFTRIMKEYNNLKKWAKRYLLMTLIISIAAIIIGFGILFILGEPFQGPKQDKTKGGEKEKSPLGSILTSITGLLSGGTLFSTLFSLITSKDEDDVYFIGKNGEEDNEELNKYDKQNKKLRSVRNKYRVISVLGALLLIIFAVIVFTTIFFNNYDEEFEPEECQTFTNCLNFMRSLNLTIGEYTILCNVTDTTATGTNATVPTSAPPDAPTQPLNALDATDKLSTCQTKIMGCPKTGIFDVRKSYYSNTGNCNYNETSDEFICNSQSQYVQVYFGYCYGGYYYYYYYDDYGIPAFIIMLVGFYGVVNYICMNNILSILNEPKGIKGGFKLVFVPIVLLNLPIVGLVPGCCCCFKKVVGVPDEDYDVIKCCCCTVKVPRIVFDKKKEDYLNKFRRVITY